VIVSDEPMPLSGYREKLTRLREHSHVTIEVEVKTIISQDDALRQAIPICIDMHRRSGGMGAAIDCVCFRRSRGALFAV
jgi:hypothetical protein